MRLILIIVLANYMFARSPPVLLTGENFYRCLNAFSLDVMKKVEYNTKNVVYSPLSIGMALGMVLEGAQNDNKVKLFELLHCLYYANRDEAIHQQFKALLTEYKDMASRETNKRNTTVELANLAMVQEGITLPSTFTEALKIDYEASVGNENFATNGQQVVEKINKFVKERTHDLIPKLFDEPLDKNTILVLINTIFFKAYWTDFFETELNVNKTFYNADKKEKIVEMMRQPDTYLNYYHSDKHKAKFVEIPYLGEMSMYVVLPDEKYGLQQVLQNWKPLELHAIIPQMKNTNVNLGLPKFNFDYKIDLKDIFKKLGVDIEDALKPVHSSLKISGAIHKAKIQTHETGTEAAAVTVIHGVGLSLKPPPIPIICDHPFLFLILDKKSKVNIFSGAVNHFD